MRSILFILFFASASSSLRAQKVHFIDSGTIEYERSVNLYAIGKKLGSSEFSFEGFKNTNPQFYKLQSQLLFNKTKALFSPAAVKGPGVNFYSNIPFPFAEQRNIVFSDLTTGQKIIKKNLLGTYMVIRSSSRKINWKITDEYRDVAGFKCRRANALILDSVYVVAFYTDEIHVSAGPESFAGLPGMILELALPHENVIWKAVRVTPAGNDEKVDIIPPPQKGAISNEQLIESVSSSMNSLAPKLKSLMVKDFLL